MPNLLQRAFLGLYCCGILPPKPHMLYSDRGAIRSSTERPIELDILQVQSTKRWILQRHLAQSCTPEHYDPITGS